MKRAVIFLVISLFGATAFAQEAIRIEDAAKHVGDSVTICTKVFGGRYFENGNRQPTLLNAGAKYPDAPLTIVIFGENRAAFSNKPEEFYTGKEVCVTGRIILFKEKPEIIITTEAQISIKQ